MKPDEPLYRGVDGALVAEFAKNSDAGGAKGPNSWRIRLQRSQIAASCDCPVLAPMLFHAVGGPGVGKVLLPMHLPVLLAGLTLSPSVAAAVGFLAPLASGLLTPMPPLPIALLMAPELAALGGVAALVYRRVSSRRGGIFVATVAAMLADRLALSLWFLMAGSSLGVELAWHKYVAAAVTIGAPGIALQLAVIPATVKAIERLGLTR